MAIVLKIDVARTIEECNARFKQKALEECGDCIISLSDLEQIEKYLTISYKYKGRVCKQGTKNPDSSAEWKDYHVHVPFVIPNKKEGMLFCELPERAMGVAYWWIKEAKI